MKSRWTAAIAGVFLIGGLGVRYVGDPTLVRFPLNVDQTLHYAGTATEFADPLTAAPLATPAVLPLTIDRRVKVVSGTYGHAVVDESIAMTFGGTTRTETYRYVMDRRTMTLESSAGSYAFGSPANPMPAAGTFRISLPLGTSSQGTYLAWAPQTASAATLTATGPAHHDARSGATVVSFNSNLDHPVAAYYAQWLRGTGAPDTLPVASAVAELTAHGADLGRLLADVGPKVTPAQLSALTAALSRPVPLSYSYFEQGRIAVEPTTGAIVDAGSSREGLSVTPDLSGAQAAEAILAPFANLPSVAAVSRALTALAAPQVVLQLTYDQTPASVRAMADTAHSQAARMALIRWQLPLLLVALGLVVAALGVWRRPRHPGAVASLPAGGSSPAPPARPAPVPAPPARGEPPADDRAVSGPATTSTRAISTGEPAPPGPVPTGKGG